MILNIQMLQAICRIQMAKKYNAAHLIHIFNIEDVVMVAIPAKN